MYIQTQHKSEKDQENLEGALLIGETQNQEQVGNAASSSSPQKTTVHQKTGAKEEIDHKPHAFTIQPSV
jgi:hypothetical protein